MIAMDAYIDIPSGQQFFREKDETVDNFKIRINNALDKHEKAEKEKYKNPDHVA